MSTRYPNLAQIVRRRAFRQGGGTTLGILLGIVIGLAIAVVTALFVTRTSLPFVGQANKQKEKPAATAATPATAAVPDAPKPQVPVAAGDVPDPNRPAASRQRAAPGQPPLERREVATVTATAPYPPPQPSAPQQQGVPPPSNPVGAAPAGARPTVIPGVSSGAAGAPPAATGSGNAAGNPRIPGNPNDPNTSAAPAPIRAATPSSPPAAPGQPPATQAAAAASERGATYLLQAGAFRGSDEADAMKLRLALMGLEAQIVTADVSGTTLYRVRIGPYAGLEAMNRARSRLSENGVEATVLRQR